MGMKPRKRRSWRQSVVDDKAWFYSGGNYGYGHVWYFDFRKKWAASTMHSHSLHNTKELAMKAVEQGCND